MTPNLLLFAIKEFIEAALEGDVQAPPAVHLGYLPEKTAATVEVSSFPYVIVRLDKGEDHDEESKVSVKLIFGTKSEDDLGFMDVSNIMERVRIALLRQRIIDQQFELQLPYKWELFEEQPAPEWIGQATTLWKLPAIQKEVVF